MERALQVFMDYAAAFEQTYEDDDWTRLEPYFADDAIYEVRGGPMACRIAGREAIFAGLKKSLDGLDRRSSERQLELTNGPNIESSGDGHDIDIEWTATYQFGNAPKVVLVGGSGFTVVDGVIVAMHDHYRDQDLEKIGAWMSEHGQGLDGSYV